MPAFTQTRRLVRQALSEITGERCSTSRAHRLAEVIYSIWSGDEVPDMHADPTAREAIRRVMSRMEATA